MHRQARRVLVGGIGLTMALFLSGMSIGALSLLDNGLSLEKKLSDAIDGWKMRELDADDERAIRRVAQCGQ